MERIRLQRRRPSSARRHELPPPTRRGATLIEIMIVLTIMVVAAGLFSRMVIAAHGLRQVNRENALAAEAARVVIERMRNRPFEDLFRLYDPDPSDDPGGAGTAPGNRFEVLGLDPLPSSPDGLQLEVILPAFPPGTPSQLVGTKWEYESTTVGTGSTWELREDYADEALGMPRDLNGDSIVDSEDHASDYVLLPVLIRVQWKGSHGPRTYEVHTMITEMRKE